MAVSLVCERLTGGTIVAIDRSATATGLAARRNAGHVAAGRARIVTGTLRTAGLDGESFDKVFAVNVNLFWTGPAAGELASISGLLAPGGTLHLFYEPPGAERAAELAERLPVVLAAGGFAVELSTGVTSEGRALVGVACRRQ